MPNSFAFDTAFSTLIVAAYGVDFLDPENPAFPVDPQQSVFPCSSVTVAIVLLNVACTYMCPFGTCRFTFFAVVITSSAISIYLSRATSFLLSFLHLLALLLRVSLPPLL